MGWEIPTFLAKRILRSDQVDRKFLSVNKNLFLERNINFNKFLDNIKDDLQLYIYNPEKLFCDDSICYAHEKIIHYFMMTITYQVWGQKNVKRFDKIYK